jgi:type IV pilus assembly protein PilW
MNASRVVERSSVTNQFGVTLVELLVSMAVALLVLAGVVQAMVDNKMKFLLNDQLAVIQENARFAIEEISYDLRMAGYRGCSNSAKVANVINSTSSVYSGFGVEGWDSDEGAGNFPSEFNSDLWSFNDANVTDPDAFIVRRVNTDNSYTTDSSSTNTGNSVVLSIYGVHDIKKGAVMVVATPDCSQVSIFQNSQQNNNNNANHFSSNVGNSVDPGNCEKSDLFGSGDCSDQSGLQQKSFSAGSTVMEFTSNAYYIGPSSIDASIPSLYRESLGTSGGNSVTAAVELLIGVENMQLLYGIDTDATPDGLANQYVQADDITGGVDWDNVVSARVMLLLRSPNSVWNEDQTFEFEGEDYSDRFLRQQVTTTVQLRTIGLPTQ